MTDVLVNWWKGARWVEVPEVRPKDFPNARKAWTNEEATILERLLPRYGVNRTAWALGRTEEGIMKMAGRLNVSYRRKTVKAVDKLGRVA